MCIKQKENRQKGLGYSGLGYVCAYIEHMYATQLYAYAYHEYASACMKHAYAYTPRTLKPRKCKTKTQKTRI